MNKMTVISIVSALLISGAAYGDDANILSHDLAQALVDHDQQWTKARTPLTLNGNANVSSCASYIERGAGADETLTAQLASSEYVLCEAMSLLKNSRAHYTTTITTFGQALYEHIDFRSVPTSLNQLADTTHVVMSSIADIPVAISGNSITSDTAEWFFKLEVVALADLNNNHQQDWIIWMTDEAKEGNYRAYKTLIIYDPPTHSHWRAVTFPR